MTRLTIPEDKRGDPHAYVAAVAADLGRECRLVYHAAAFVPHPRRGQTSHIATVVVESLADAEPLTGRPGELIEQRLQVWVDGVPFAGGPLAHHWETS